MRFKIVDGEEAAKYDEEIAEELELGFDFPSYLLDTEHKTIVFCDRMEPEDACLGRALYPLVQLLNEVE